MSFLSQFQQDLKLFREEMTWKSIKRLTKNPVELRSYTSVYFFFSLLLFMSTLWAAYDEFSSVNYLKDLPRREWREWIKEYKEIGLNLTRLKKDQLLYAKDEQGNDLAGQISTLKIRLRIVTDSVSNLSIYEEAKNKYILYFNQLRDESVVLSGMKAKDAQAYFFYTDALKKNDFKEIKRMKTEIDSYADSIYIIGLKIEKIRTLRDEQKSKIGEFEKPINDLHDHIEKLNADLIQLKNDSTIYSEVKSRISQVVMKDYATNNFFDLEMNIDRCQSCHLAWNDSLFDNKSEQSFKFKGQADSLQQIYKIPSFYKKISYKEFAHMHWKYEAPLTVEEFYSLKEEERAKILEELALKYSGTVRIPTPEPLTANHSDKLEIRTDPLQYHSPEILKVHNVDKMGCISCHQGQGIAIDIGEAHSRHHEPGYDHYWEKPLLQGKFVESSCQSCHPTSVNLTMGETVSLGRKLIMDIGCWACHQIPLDKYYKLRKVGPQLNSLMAKTTPQFIYRWIKNPKNFYTFSRMPNFYLSENDAMAITAYLSNLSKTSSYQPDKYPGNGDVEKGSQLVMRVGCTACHSVGDIQWSKLSATPFLKEGAGFAPNLDKIGSKANADWIYDWIKYPKKYHPETRMPDLRLTDQEAADVTAYLLTLKEKNENPDITGFDSYKLEDHKLIAMGSKLIEQKGCYGCHDLKEHNQFSNISVSLTEISDKNVHNLDFGNSVAANPKHHNHTWEGWIKGKVRDPRQYQTDRIPLAMPNFGLNETEIEAIAVALKGWTKRSVTDGYKPAPSPVIKARDLGQVFFRDNNCVGCHQIENYKSGHIRDQINQELLLGLDPFEFGNDIAYAPPVLVTSGSRYQESWLLKFLKDPTLGQEYGIRPNFLVRMPSFDFSEDEMNVVLNYFHATEGKSMKLKDNSPPKTTPEKIALGKDLVAKFDCQKCHSVGGEPKDIFISKYAPDLREVANKLKPDWTHKWLGDPQSFIRSTKMLPNWGNGFLKVDFPTPNSGMTVEEEARYQGEAVRDYLYTLKREMKYHRN